MSKLESWCASMSSRNADSKWGTSPGRTGAFFCFRWTGARYWVEFWTKYQSNTVTQPPPWRLKQNSHIHTLQTNKTVSCIWASLDLQWVNNLALVPWARRLGLLTNVLTLSTIHPTVKFQMCYFVFPEPPHFFWQFYSNISDSLHLFWRD